MSRVETVLVVGAGGFIGGFITAALRAEGYRVLEGVRLGTGGSRAGRLDCDLARMTQPSDWSGVLEGVDAVVNAAGILRASRGNGFQRVHFDGPLALARACVDAGVQRFVQVSALGDPADGPFISSKHRFDAALTKLPIKSVVLRPSVVYAPDGSYGGTSLLRALAATPGVQCVPGSGGWLLQPVSADDLGRLVVQALSAGSGVFEVVGPERMSLLDYQRQWRSWLRLRSGLVVHVPGWLVDPAVRAMDILGRGPVGRTMWRMLKRGNVGTPGAHARLHETFGIAPRKLADVLASRPSQVQDRWHARLYFLAPVMHASLVVLWLLSGWVGLTAPAEGINALVGGSVMEGLSPVALARATGALDVLAALALASGWRPRLVIAAMMSMLLAYTVAFGMLVPSTWLDPLGGLAKNLVLLPAMAMAWVTADRR